MSLPSLGATRQYFAGDGLAIASCDAYRKGAPYTTAGRHELHSCQPHLAAPCCWVLVSTVVFDICKLISSRKIGVDESAVRSPPEDELTQFFDACSRIDASVANL